MSPAEVDTVQPSRACGSSPVTPRVADDGGAAVGGALGERVRHARRVDVSVGREVRGGEDAVDVASGNSSQARSGETISSGTPSALCDPEHLLELMRAGRRVVAIRTLPHRWKSTGRPVSASSPS